MFESPENIFYEAKVTFILDLPESKSDLFIFESIWRFAQYLMRFPQRVYEKLLSLNEKCDLYGHIDIEKSNKFILESHWTLVPNLKNFSPGMMRYCFNKNGNAEKLNIRNNKPFSFKSVRSLCWHCAAHARGILWKKQHRVIRLLSETINPKGYHHFPTALWAFFHKITSM